MKLPPDIRNALLAFAALIVIGLIIAEAVRADDWQRPDQGWLPSGAYVYLGIDADAPVGGGGHPYCRDMSHEVGRVGFHIPAWRGGRHTFVAVFDHQSCLQEEDDRASAEWLGIRYQFGLW